jgi:sugar/nucleoside kinase (ribokinase family)
MKDIDITGIASGLYTRIFEYPQENLKELEKQFGFKQNSFSWLLTLPTFKPEEVHGVCFSTVEESLIIAAHYGRRLRTNVLFAKCGNDAIGTEFTGLIRGYGIRFETPPTSESPTFTTQIYVAQNDKESTILSLIGGASNQLAVSDIKEDIIMRSRYLMADAYNISLPNLHRVTVYASTLAHKHNTKIVYGLGRSEVIRDNRNRLEQFINDCKPDLLHGNQFEFKELLFRNPKKPIPDEDLSKAAQIYIRSRNIEVAIITFAERGSYVICHDGLIQVSAFPVPESRIKDKACAGTAYMGGFLEARCQGKDYEVAGKWGSYAASQTLRQFGLKPDWKLPPFVSGGH